VEHNTARRRVRRGPEPNSETEEGNAMGAVQITADMREAGDKGHARRLRMEKKIPAILYGVGEQSVPVALHGHTFEQMLRHISSGNQILELTINGRPGAPVPVLIKEVQRNPIDQKILHVDLQHISMTKKVRVHVPIHLTGTALGVKEGGILEHFLRELDIECLPAEIPESVTVDVAALARGDSIHVRDLPVAPSVHVHDSADRVVVSVAGKQKEEVVETAVAAEAEAAPVAEAAKTEKGGKAAPAAAKAAPAPAKAEKAPAKPAKAAKKS
jgi:large subunit ribosomal protein L25